MELRKSQKLTNPIGGVCVHVCRLITNRAMSSPVRPSLWPRKLARGLARCTLMDAGDPLPGNSYAQRQSQRLPWKPPACPFLVFSGIAFPAVASVVICAGGHHKNEIYPMLQHKTLSHPRALTSAIGSQCQSSVSTPPTPWSSFPTILRMSLPLVFQSPWWTPWASTPGLRQKEHEEHCPGFPNTSPSGFQDRARDLLLSFLTVQLGLCCCHSQKAGDASLPLVHAVQDPVSTFDTL